MSNYQELLRNLIVHIDSEIKYSDRLPVIGDTFRDVAKREGMKEAYENVIAFLNHAGIELDSNGELINPYDLFSIIEYADGSLTWVQSIYAENVAAMHPGSKVKIGGLAADEAKEYVRDKTPSSFDVGPIFEEPKQGLCTLLFGGYKITIDTNNTQPYIKS